MKIGKPMTFALGCLVGVITMILTDTRKPQDQQPIETNQGKRSPEKTAKEVFDQTGYTTVTIPGSDQLRTLASVGPCEATMLRSFSGLTAPGTKYNPVINYKDTHAPARARRPWRSLPLRQRMNRVFRQVHGTTLSLIDENGLLPNTSTGYPRKWKKSRPKLNIRSLKFIIEYLEKEVERLEKENQQHRPVRARKPRRSQLDPDKEYWLRRIEP